MQCSYDVYAGVCTMLETSKPLVLDMCACIGDSCMDQFCIDGPAQNHFGLLIQKVPVFCVKTNIDTN